MDKKINEGDIINVYYNNGGAQYTNLKVLHVACDVGDLWYFEKHDGTIIAQNPCSTNLDTIVKNPQGETQCFNEPA